MVQNFLKEVIVNINNNSILVIANKKEQQEGLDFLIEKILLEKNEDIILISLTRKSEDILNKFKDERLKVIDGFSENFKENKNTIYMGPECNLTKLQISVEKTYDVAAKKAIVIIDSINRLAVYNNPRELSKFIYLFSNKIKLDGSSGIFFVEKSSFDVDSLERIKSFSDKTFDYSTLSAINILSVK